MRYIIEYSNGDRKVQVVRKAISSVDAVKKLIHQYLWSWKLSLVDADTRGNEWCSGLIDTNGGINYDVFVVCYKAEDEM